MAKINKVPTNQADGKQLTHLQREKVKGKVVDLYLKGLSYRSIKAVLDEESGKSVSIATIGKYINGTIQEWKDERLKALDDIKETELRRINKLETTYWDAWEKSVQEHKKKTDKQKAIPMVKDGKMFVKEAEKTVHVEERYGNPQYLAGIQWCISMRCKILGIEAPQVTEVNLRGEIARTTVFMTKSRKNKPE